MNLGRVRYSLRQDDRAKVGLPGDRLVEESRAKTVRGRSLV